MKRILIAGANGLIARHLTQHFATKGWEVVGLARRKEGLHPDCRYVNWDGENLGSWAAELEQADILINLVGKSVNCRFTPKNRELIMSSRVNSTRILGQAMAACKHPPEVWVNASGANYYCDSSEHAHGEDGDRGEGFMTDVVVAWEKALFESKVPQQVRRVALRTTMVLADTPGNPLGIFRKLAKFGLAGKISHGKQMVSWIHIDDVCRAVEWIVEREDLSGPVNMAAPEPLSNADFMRRFRESVSMPIGLPAAAWMVKIGTYLQGMEPELILDSLWVVPDKLQSSGFEFKYPKLSPQDW
ncbi:MAG: TIGR01777 family oxidoreductase [Verrucomicrobiae bacterium]|nr:TIGR01777 family oxidoreductase [Verrucomicrobiae bacterium]NNJ86173.1 TIGR01777 family protein [Akkermansiaceae bacterium]